MKWNRKKFAVAALLLALAIPGMALGHGTQAKAPDFRTLCTGKSLDEAAAAVDAELREHPDDAALKKFALELKKNGRRAQLFEQEQNPEMAAKTGKLLRQFFYRNDMLAEAEKVDRQLFKLNPDIANGVSLAETLLNRNRDREAAELLLSLKPAEADREANLLAALALARTGDVAESQEYLARTPFESCKPQELMIYARIAALHDDAAQAAAAVARILENAPAKESRALQAYFQDDDFRHVLPDAAYQAALQTESKAGDSCAGCPNSGTSRCDGGDCD